MLRIRRSVSVAVVAVGLTAFPSVAHADSTYTNVRVYNRMDGSRLALWSDATGEGTTALTLRSPAWKYKTARWTFTERSDGYYVFKNEAADKCLQPATATPKAGDSLVVKTCDNSALQDWSRRNEETNANINTGWGSFRPRVDTTLAITLKTYEGSGSWDQIYLDQDQNSTDRLWRLTRGDATWW